MLLRILLGILFFPILFAMLVLFALMVCLWNLVSWLSQFASWVIATTVVMGLLAVYCIAVAVWAW